MRQAIIWTKDGLVYWHRYASLGISGLNNQITALFLEISIGVDINMFDAENKKWNRTWNHIPNKVYKLVSDAKWGSLWCNRWLMKPMIYEVCLSSFDWSIYWIISSTHFTLRSNFWVPFSSGVFSLSDIWRTTKVFSHNGLYYSSLPTEFCCFRLGLLRKPTPLWIFFST